MKQPTKRPPNVWRAFFWFLIYATIGTALAIGFVFLADAISPALGTAAGKWALIVALVTAYQMAKQKNEPAAQPPPLPQNVLYYYRRGAEGVISGPETLLEIRRISQGASDIEIVEARGEPYGNLERASWENLSRSEAKD